VNANSLSIPASSLLFPIIPRGVEHFPSADEEAHVMLLEPKTTLNTGNVQSERTVAELERI
jgi:hypothetical protein